MPWEGIRHFKNAACKCSEALKARAAQSVTASLLGTCRPGMQGFSCTGDPVGHSGSVFQCGRVRWTLNRPAQLPNHSRVAPAQTSRHDPVSPSECPWLCPTAQNHHRYPEAEGAVPQASLTCSPGKKPVPSSAGSTTPPCGMGLTPTPSLSTF